MTRPKVLTGITLGPRLGAGSFGAVYLGDWNGTPVAMKTLDQREDVSAFLSEVSILATLTHPNVVQFLGTWVDPSHPELQLYMVVEHVSGGDLLTHLQRGPVPPAQKLGMLVDAARGMLFLAENKIVHRDLACRNLLIDVAGTVKISDFGMSRLVEDYYEADRSKPLPVRWSAPEIFLTRKSSTRSDVFSFGIVMWEILTNGWVPYPTLDTNREVREVVIAGGAAGVLPRPKECPDTLYVLMSSCWAMEPWERPTFADILERLLAVSAAHAGVAHAAPAASAPPDAASPPPYAASHAPAPPPYSQRVHLGYSQEC